LANVRRHAGAREAAVLLAYGASSVRLAIRDDGRGFDPSLVGRRSHGVRLHLGIETLLERAELAGGTATVDSKPGQGTEVTFELPLSGAPLAES